MTPGDLSEGLAIYMFEVGVAKGLKDALDATSSDEDGVRSRTLQKMYEEQRTKALDMGKTYSDGIERSEKKRT